MGESPEACAVREVAEETGLVVQDVDVRFLTATNDIFASEGKHYVTLFVACRIGDDVKPEVSRTASRADTVLLVLTPLLACLAGPRAREVRAMGVAELGALEGARARPEQQPVPPAAEPDLAATRAGSSSCLCNVGMNSTSLREHLQLREMPVSSKGKRARALQEQRTGEHS